MLDIDGPMIPVKAFYLPNQTTSAKVFDPCAVGMLLRLIEMTGALIVISSIHRLSGYDHIKNLFAINNIPLTHLHKDWRTTTNTRLSRSEEIRLWLDEHLNVESYVAIDDELLDDSIVSTRCCGYEGFGLKNFIECKLTLNAYDKKCSVPEEVQRTQWTTTLKWLSRPNHTTIE